MTPLSIIRTLCEIDFSETGNSVDFIVDGWSEPEPTFTWALGASSSIELANIPAGGDIIFDLTVWPMVQAPMVPSQRLSVTANGEFVADINIVQPATLFCRIPQSVLRDDGRLTITFSHPDAKRPSDVVPGNEDMRVLSLAFERMTVRALGMAPEIARTQRGFGRSKSDAIIFGNCQADILATGFNQCPTLSRHMRFHGFANFPGPDGRTVPIPQDLKDRAALFVHQVGNWGRQSPDMEGLNSACMVVHFPPVGSNALWPLKQPWPKDKAGPNALRWTEHHGDKLAIRLALKDISRTDYLAAYVATDIASITNLTRRHELDLEWIKKNEEISDIHISDFVQQHFSSHRLYWMGGHLTNFFYCELARRLATMFADRGTRPFDLYIDTILAEIEDVFAGPELHDALQIPINPQVAAALDLRWYDADYVYTTQNMPAWRFTDYLLAIYDDLNA